MMWDISRIEEEHKLKEKYGLKTLREIWRAKSEIRRIRSNVRAVLSTRANESMGKQIIERLARFSVIKSDAPLDDLLVINADALLERRLQSLVFKMGLATSIRQSRQLITHGFIKIGDRRVRSPGYIVREEEESTIGYYKPIKIRPDAPAAPHATEAGITAGPEQADAVVQEAS
jgi:small subunit ribosomal protein S4